MAASAVTELGEHVDVLRGRAHDVRLAHHGREEVDDVVRRGAPEERLEAHVVEQTVLVGGPHQLDRLRAGRPTDSTRSLSD
jgi:hypothetical protein